MYISTCLCLPSYHTSLLPPMSRVAIDFQESIQNYQIYAQYWPDIEAFSIGPWCASAITELDLIARLVTKTIEMETSVQS